MSSIFIISNNKGLALCYATDPNAVEAYCKNKWAVDRGYLDLADGILGDGDELLQGMCPGDTIWIYEACCYEDDEFGLPEGAVVDFKVQCVEAFDTFDDVIASMKEGQ